MIIGKSITTLGGGGLKPTIVVNAPTGSTVTCDGTVVPEDRVLNPAWRNLPSGYTQVEYIESSGSQYIDTGYDQLYSNTIKFEFTISPSTVNDEYYFGGNGTTQCKIGPSNGFSAEVKSNCVLLHTSNSNTTVTTDGVLRSTFSFSGYDNLSILLFALGMNSGADYYSNGKLFDYKLYVNTNLVRDFVPCLNTSTGKYGMYDLVSNTFFGNLGTGDFTGGEAVTEYINAGTWTKETTLGTHTIVATKGTSSKTKTVLVDEVAVFEVTILYSRLPSGYTEVEYIQSSGTQYINTRIIPKLTHIYKSKVRFTSVSTNQTLLAVYESNKSSYQLPLCFNGDISSWIVQAGTEWASYGTKDVSLHNFIIDYVNRTLTIDNIDYNITSTISMNNLTLPYYLLSANDGGTSIERYANAQLYNLEIFDNTTQVCNFVPCINPSNVVGMYDLVSQSFFGNSGSGVFVAGNPV